MGGYIFNLNLQKHHSQVEPRNEISSCPDNLGNRFQRSNNI